MAVSANTLFHFTQLKGLEGILSSGGFYCQYSDEHFEHILPEGNPFSFSFIPMISFCDLTITQLARDSVHTEHFGSYGIGLTKEWGIRNKISPVLYVHKESRPTNQLTELIEKLKTLPKEEGEKFIFTQASELIDELVDSFKFIKPYTGKWQKGEIKGEEDSIIYYNEREWRYCPSMNENRVLSASIEDNKEEKEKLNLEMKGKMITFHPEEIKFIIIQNKSDIPNIVNIIKAMNIDENRKNEVITKIITFEEINTDY